MCSQDEKALHFALGVLDPTYFLPAAALHPLELPPLPGGTDTPYKLSKFRLPVLMKKQTSNLSLIGETENPFPNEWELPCIEPGFI